MERHIVDNINNLPDTKLRAPPTRNSGRAASPANGPSSHPGNVRHANGGSAGFESPLSRMPDMGRQHAAAEAAEVADGYGEGEDDDGIHGLAAALEASQQRCARARGRHTQIWPFVRMKWPLGWLVVVSGCGLGAM